MKLVPNPKYKDAPFEGRAVGKSGRKMSNKITSLVFGRIVPPRFIRLPNGKLEEVPSHIPETNK